MNTLLIIFDRNTTENNKELLLERITQLGQTFNFWDNHYFLKTNLTVKEVNDKIAFDQLELLSIIIFKLGDDGGEYYGRMKTNLWQWLKEDDLQ